MEDKTKNKTTSLKFSSKQDYEYKLNELIGYNDRKYLKLYF
jgi:hypothetical protein